MISVSIWRKTLEKHDACKEGLALYDSIAALLPETDARRTRRIRIADWGQGVRWREAMDRLAKLVGEEQ